MSASARRRRPFLDVDAPLLFAHRGGAALFPENTLDAFRGALELGIPFLETDVHLSRDGVLVVHHDATVNRTTNGSGKVADLTLSELRKLDAGYRFSPGGGAFPFRGKGLTIPTLEEAFALSPTVRFNVELKTAGRAAAHALWSFIEAGELHDRILVAAEVHATIRRFRRLSRERVATSASHREALAFLAATRLHLDGVLPVAFDALQIPVRHRGVRVLDRRLVQAAHRHGVQVHAWTIDDPAEMRELLALGVDGLMSDRPDLLAPLANPGSRMPGGGRSSRG
jgi:glycerophosphoryl diester phosphodiesterase